MKVLTILCYLTQVIEEINLLNIHLKILLMERLAKHLNGELKQQMVMRHLILS